MSFQMWSSKFRHVYGETHRKEKCYENVKITRNAHDSNFCAVNPKYLAVVTESAGGGAFVVLPLARTGRVDINTPQICGHAGSVLDIKWNPFKDDIIASGSDDNTIPEGGLRSNLNEWQVDLHGHSRRVGYIEWHPTAENIILSAGLDYKCMIWNVEQAEPVNVISCHNDTIQSISWNWEGSLFCTTCKDRSLRIVEPRTGQCVVEFANSFKGNRPSKGLFLGEKNKVFCTGFNNSGEREIAIWDIRNMKTALTRKTVDNSNGILMPYYDHDTNIVFLAGKGDGNIRYYEIVEDDQYCHYLSTFGSSSPQRGLGVMPKRGCDASRCEIMRFFKLHAARNFVEPISMIVPRKSNTFHEDLFPPTASAIASLTADEWISGQNREPIQISMKDNLVINDPQYTPTKACQLQDVGLNQSPTITTYKVVSALFNQGLDSEEPSKSKHKIPASLKNIKRLSTSEDIVTLTPGDIKTDKEKSSTVTQDTPTDKAFVNSKIAAFESKASPNKRRNDRQSWSTSQERSTSQDNPPEQIANGIKSTAEPKSVSQWTGQNAGDFGHKQLEIIDITKSEKKDKINEEKEVDKATLDSRLIFGDINDDRNSISNKIHVKKTWSPIKTPSSPMWEDGINMPSADPELRKAYFQQAQEIKSLKEQVFLKDKRIRQLEDEMNVLRKGLPTKEDSSG